MARRSRAEIGICVRRDRGAQRRGGGDARQRARGRPTLHDDAQREHKPPRRPPGAASDGKIADGGAIREMSRDAARPLPTAIVSAPRGAAGRTDARRPCEVAMATVTRQLARALRPTLSVTAFGSRAWRHGSSTTSPRTSNAPRRLTRAISAPKSSPFPRLAHESPVRRRRARALPVGADHPRRGAHSLQMLLDSGDWAAQHAREQLLTFSLPRYGASTKRALRVAVGKIGMLYIWGGETDGKSSLRLSGAGGYDCSGFVWRVFKLSGQARASASAVVPPRRWWARSASPERRAHGRDPPRRSGLLRRASFNAKATEAGVDHVGMRSPSTG